MSDLLLEWMSFRGEGRIQDLPAELIGGAPRRLLNDLALLAHIEVTDSSRWRVAPPVLAELPVLERNDAQAVLCGARTPGVVEALRTGCRTAGAEMHMAAISDRPSVVVISSTSKPGLRDAALASSIPLQSDAAYTLLACLPSVREWPRKQCPMVAGRVERVQRFSRSRMRWIETTLDEATAASKGLFRIKRDWDSVTILKTSESNCAYIDDRVGRIAVAAKLRAVGWGRADSVLSWPIQLFPPAIVARALTLCSGKLPRFSPENKRISFFGVSLPMLRLTLAVTGLRLA
jgi:hypothetical protein